MIQRFINPFFFFKKNLNSTNAVEPSHDRCVDQQFDYLIEEKNRRKRKVEER